MSLPWLGLVLILWTCSLGCVVRASSTTQPCTEVRSSTRRQCDETLCCSKWSLATAPGIKGRFGYPKAWDAMPCIYATDLTIETTEKHSEGSSRQVLSSGIFGNLLVVESKAKAKAEPDLFVKVHHRYVTSKAENFLVGDANQVDGMVVEVSVRNFAVENVSHGELGYGCAVDTRKLRIKADTDECKGHVCIHLYRL